MWKHIKRVLDIPVLVIGEILRYYLNVRGTDKDTANIYRTKLLDRLEKSIPYLAIWIVIEFSFIGVWIHNHINCCMMMFK